MDNIADLNADMPDIIQALRMMPAEQSILIAGAYIIGLRQREIAALLHIDQSSVARNLRIAVHQLKKNINQ